MEPSVLMNKVLKAGLSILFPVLIAALLITVAACGNNVSSEENRAVEHELTQGEEVGEVQFQPAASVEEATLEKVKSQGPGAYIIPPEDAVTAKGNPYLAVYDGEKPTAGYHIEVVRVREVDETLHVQARLRQPGPGDIVAQVLTHPVEIVKLEGVPSQGQWSELAITLEWI